MQIRFTHGHVCNSSSAMTAVASNVHISFTVIPDDYLFLMVHRKLLMNQCPFLIRNINFIFPLNFIVCNLSANTFFRKKQPICQSVWSEIYLFQKGISNMCFIFIHENRSNLFEIFNSIKQRKLCNSLAFNNYLLLWFCNNNLLLWKEL